MSFTGKTVIVTGAASGIGEETAAEVLRRGARVIGVDRNPTPATDEHVFVDFTDLASIHEAVAQLPEGANGLANIAGVPPSADAETVLKVNIRGLRVLTEALVPKLADGASIVNLASLSGIGWESAVDQIEEFETVEWDDIAAFAAKHDMDRDGRSYFFSKEALVVWTMKNRWTWRDRGIRMNAVSPGPVDTPILPDFLETLGERAAIAMRLMDRLGRADDIAPVVAFLLSDESAWFRGANVSPDGGMAAHHLLRRHGLE